MWPLPKPLSSASDSFIFRGRALLACADVCLALGGGLALRVEEGRNVWSSKKAAALHGQQLVGSFGSLGEQQREGRLGLHAIHMD